MKAKKVTTKKKVVVKKKTMKKVGKKTMSPAQAKFFAKKTTKMPMKAM